MIYVFLLCNILTQVDDTGDQSPKYGVTGITLVLSVVYIGAKDTDFAHGDENQWDPQRISTSILFSRIFLTTCNLL